MIEFKEYIAFLSTNGLLGLGKVENPKTGKKSKNLKLVKFTIDILELLEKKTEGNLTEEEEEILANTLNNLRENYKKEKEAE
ncbi:MAG: DUF1844 domain-containing protein [Candidatus Mcinerneyibacterium aminivorans]|uniref:DUF1844 domain-containing protein n=1 Tax=Candidatus Mcinerneyibacterium aminivorans TaxID=2703815 RepID=A0A5D0MHH9_9BACT|nr:MAG: DUF1844 domain-containing protein [Candidatus Mcinerneyibacterium aminivorans]